METKPIKWTFNGLLSKKTMFLSGGNSGAVVSQEIANGVSIYVPYVSGVETFTIWKNGGSFWNTQHSFLGRSNSQQYIGTCTN